MAKRFVDTNKYKKPFMRALPGAYKLLWDYICLDCDHAGIWQVDFEVARIYLGNDMTITKELAVGYFNTGEERIQVLNGGSRWFIKPFIEFQYGVLDPNNRAHLSVIRILEKEGVYKTLTRPYLGCKDMDKDMDKDKDKVKEKNLFVIPDWVDAPTWDAFVNMRKSIKKPMGDAAKALAIKELEKLKGLGQSPKAVLEQSIMNSWQGIFPLKEKAPWDKKVGCAPVPGKYDNIGEKV